MKPLLFILRSARFGAVAVFSTLAACAALLPSTAAPQGPAQAPATPQVSGTPHGVVFRRGEPGKPAYFLRTKEERQGDLLRSISEFTAPDGTLHVREITTYKAGQLIRYDYDQAQMKEGGFLEKRGDQVWFEFTDHSGKSTGSDDFPEEPILPDTIHSFLTRHVKEILAGDSVKGRFLLLERQDTIGFKFFLDGKEVCSGTPCLRIKMKPSSIIIAALVDPVWIRLEADPPHRLISTDGRLAIREPEVPDPKDRHDYKAIDALLVFSSMASSSSEGSISSSRSGNSSGSSSGTAGASSKASRARSSRR